MIYRADGIKIKSSIGFIASWQTARDGESADAVATQMIWPDKGSNESQENEYDTKFK